MYASHKCGSRYDAEIFGGQFSFVTFIAVAFYKFLVKIIIDSQLKRLGIVHSIFLHIAEFQCYPKEILLQGVFV